MDEKIRQTGLVGRIRLLFRQCPRCRKRLKRVIAGEESYIRNRPLPPLRGVRNIRATYTSAFVRQEQITPVYAVCETCGFRRRLRNIKERIS